MLGIVKNILEAFFLFGPQPKDILFICHGGGKNPENIDI